MPANNCGSISENRCLKSFAWVNDRSRERTDTHCMDPDDPIFLIEEENHKVFSVHIGKIGLEYRAGVGRTADLLLILDSQVFSG